MMNLEETITKPITMPDYRNPAEIRRYLDDEDGFYGYDYVFLEDATWNELCAHIELNFAPGEEFTPAARHYVMRFITRIPENIELPANCRVLSELLDERRHHQCAPDASASPTPVHAFAATGGRPPRQ